LTWNGHRLARTHVEIASSPPEGRVRGRRVLERELWDQRDAALGQIHAVQNVRRSTKFIMKHRFLNADLHQRFRDK
jgi:hypothetical protein